jgi:chorismate mutase
MQGVMIESHIDPSVAWTDAKQQVTPAALSDIIDSTLLYVNRKLKMLK